MSSSPLLFPTKNPRSFIPLILSTNLIFETPTHPRITRPSHVTLSSTLLHLPTGIPLTSSIERFGLPRAARFSSLASGSTGAHVAGSDVGIFMHRILGFTGRVGLGHLGFGGRFGLRGEGLRRCVEGTGEANNGGER